MIGKGRYGKALQKADRTLAKSVSDYLKDPSEDNVHDLRTSTRRLLAAVQLLPKRLRSTKKIAAYAENLEKLMKSNAKTRDLDIIIARVEQRNPSNDNSSLLKSLKALRDSSLKPGTSFARSLRPDLGLSIRDKDLSGSELERRFAKVSRKYLLRIQKRLPTVLATPDDKEELHLLRWDARKLRYILELGDQKELEDQLERLKSWQEVLGDVHDSDIFIRHFAKSKRRDETNKLLEDEAEARTRNYEKFRTIAKSPIRLEAS